MEQRRLLLNLFAKVRYTHRQFYPSEVVWNSFLHCFPKSQASWVSQNQNSSKLPWEPSLSENWTIRKVSSSNAHTDTHTYTHTLSHTHANTQRRTHTHTHKHTHKHTHTRAHTHTHAHTYKHTHTHTHWWWPMARGQKSCPGLDCWPQRTDVSFWQTDRQTGRQTDRSNWRKASGWNVLHQEQRRLCVATGGETHF